MNKKLSIPLTLLLAALFIAQPKPAHAVSVAAALCAVQQYPCAAGNTLDFGVRTNFVNALPANTWTQMPYFFGDPFVTFSGSVLAVDLSGKFIYLWATGTATDRLGGALNLDVAFQQTNYATVNGIWGFNDILIGSCAGGVGPGSTAIGQGIVDNTGLSTLTGACNGPFALAGIPLGGVLAGPTTLTAAAQFAFTAGSAAGSKINLPWGADFPDPTQFGGDFPTLTQLQNDPNLTQLSTPEPATCAMFGGALCLFALVRRRK